MESFVLYSYKYEIIKSDILLHFVEFFRMNYAMKHEFTNVKKSFFFKRGQ
jgi:hypothetical protein